MKYKWFWTLQEVVGKALLMICNINEAAVKQFADFLMKYLWFWKLQKVIQNHQEAVVKPFTYFSNEISMIWNSQEAAVKPCTYFSYEIFMVWESPGSCWETSVDDLEYQGSCCEPIHTLFL